MMIMRFIALANGQAAVMFERRQITGIVEVFNRQPNRTLSSGVWCRPAGSLAER
jgi:hypothetical protein